MKTPEKMLINSPNVKSLILLFAMSFLAQVVFADNKYFEISGWVKADQEYIRNATVEVYSDLDLIGTTKTNRWGNFILDLKMKQDYIVVVRAKGNAPKRIFFQTSNAEQFEKMSNDLYYEFIVEMYEEETNKETAFFYHMVIFDQNESNFMHLQPNISEFLHLDEDPFYQFDENPDQHLSSKTPTSARIN
ncbi:MAG: hypothetical protein ACOCUQ_01000 [Bacteroidota bacterium]